MSYSSKYYSASGFSLEEYCMLAERFHASTGPRTDTGEYWVLSAEGNGKMGFPLSASEYFTAVWLSETGVAYVVTNKGSFVHIGSGGDSRRSIEHSMEFKVGGSLKGIWGLNDQCIYAWGRDEEEETMLVHYDGDSWTIIEGPEFYVASMHGISANCIYAAGNNSGIAKWNGNEWEYFKIAVEENFTSIFVVADDEQYAVGENSYILWGDEAEWGVMGRLGIDDDNVSNPLLSIVKWKDELYIGSGRDGLLRVPSDTWQVQLLRPNIIPTAMDARGNLLITCDDMIVETSDGEDFEGSAEGFLLEVCGERALNDFSEE